MGRNFILVLRVCAIEHDSLTQMPKLTLIQFVVIFLVSTSAYSQSCLFHVDPPLAGVCPGDTICINASGNLAGSTIIEQFDFNTSTMPSGWTVSGGAAFGSPCGASLSGDDYYWSSTSGTMDPMVTTAPLDVSLGAVLQFDLVFALQGGAPPCEGPDLWDEGVNVLYSIDGGATWVLIEYFNPNGTNQTTSGPPTSGPTAFTSWGTYCLQVPLGAQTTSTMFRWGQFSGSGANFDNWGLDNVIIASSLSGTSVNWSNGSTNTSTLCIPITSDTTITAFLINSVGDTIGQDQAIITVNSTYSVSDTIMVCENGDATFADGTVLTNITSPIMHSSIFQGVNGCDSTIITTAIPIPNSTYNLLDTITVCVNEDVTFADGTVLTNLTSPTTHTSSLQTVNGCDSTIITAALINETYTVFDTIMVCENDDVTFADGAVFTNITSSISHTSSLQTISGCDSTIITAAMPIFTDASASQTDSTITASNTGTGVTYFWIDCDNNFVELSGETNQTFNPAQSGVYAVVVTQNGCSDTSSCFTIDTTASINEFDFSGVKVYPNPVTDHFTIDLGSLQNNVNVEVMDALGRTVFTRMYEIADAIIVDLEGSAGLYFLKLSVAGKRSIVALSKE
jgi:hypothetical protein